MAAIPHNAPGRADDADETARWLSVDFPTSGYAASAAGGSSAADDLSPASHLPYDGLQPPSTRPVRWRATLVSATYAGATWLMLLRVESLRIRLGIPESGPRFDLYMAATACTFVGAIAAVTFQNALLSCLDRRQRVVFGFAAFVVSHVTFLVLFYVTAEPLSTNLAVVALGYASVGFARNVCDTNTQAYVARYGADAQRYLNFGTVGGWTAAGVVYFFIVAVIGQPVALAACFHATLAFACMGAVVIFLQLPTVASEDSSCDRGDTFAKLVADVKAWREWVPQTRVPIVIAALCNGGSGFVIALVQLLFLGHSQELLPGVVASPGVYMVIFCVAEFAGGAAGSALVPRLARPNVFVGMACGVALLCLLSRVPLLALMSSALMWAALTVASTIASVTIATHAERRYTFTAMNLTMLTACVALLLLQIAAGPWSVLVGRIGGPE